MIKKLLLLIIGIVLFPINVFACPHVDSNGRVHLQTYNSDYSETNMIYPEDKHLYIKTINSSIVDYVLSYDEANVLEESFSFPILQAYEAYYNYYWYVNNNLSESYEPDSSIETTVKDLNDMTVDSDTYKLNVGLTNTYNTGMDYVNDNTEEIYYDVMVDKILDPVVMNTLVYINKLNILSTDVLEIKARYNITESEGFVYEFSTESVAILNDKINVSMIANSEIDNAVAVNINKEISNSNFIPVSRYGDYYTFDIAESGTYVVIEKIDDDIVIDNVIPDDVVDEEDDIVEDDVDTENSNVVQLEEDDNNKTIFYLLSGVGLTILVLFILFKIKNKFTNY